MTIVSSNLAVIINLSPVKSASSIISIALVSRELKGWEMSKTDVQKGLCVDMTFQAVPPFIEYMRSRSNSKVYIWGAGVYGETIGRLLDENRIVWSEYYDNYLTFEGGLNGRPVLLGENFTLDSSGLYIIAVIKSEAVRQQLQGYGAAEDNMIWFDSIDFWNDLRDKVVGKTYCSEAIRKFRNIHQGERCFVIGNGPSLALRDLEKIQEAGFVSFACNSVYKCFPQTFWRPDYYCAVDALFIREEFKEKDVLLKVLKNCQYMFARSDSYLSRYYNDHDIKNLAFCKIVVPETLPDFEFSEDCAEKIYTGYTVTYIMLQLAAYMGFSEICLLGIDHHFSYEMRDSGDVLMDGSVQDHMEEMNDSHPVVAPIEKLTRAYECAKCYADAHGIQIRNATRGGKLEVFPRVDFDSLF